MSTIERIALEDDVRAILSTAAEREVSSAAAELADVADADEPHIGLASSIERMEQALRTYREINAAEEPTRATAGHLAEREVEWRAGYDGVPLPTTGHEVDEFLGAVELHRTLIGLRDSLETEGEASA